MEETTKIRIPENLNGQLMEVAYGCTCGRIRMASRAVTALFEETMRPAGIQGASQFSLLCAITLMGEVPITRLAEVMLMDRTTVTRTLHSLEEAGWVQISPGTDRRVRMVAVTEAGREKLAYALPLWRQAQEKIVAHLSPTRWAHLMEGLQAAARIGPGADR
ncbi:MAG TPA: MarR family winged helix-turn-helix transcriptional regulator [Chthonomonadaceae bacterium]|nr:MarR family winged helix-turn-helix transcriptional regulator [Chthonomonadaceae bacterium]